MAALLARVEARLRAWSWWPSRHAVCQRGVKRAVAAIRTACWHEIDVTPPGTAFESLPWLLWGACVLPLVPGEWLEPAAYETD